MQEKNKENSIIKQRILMYLDFKGITKYRCYQETGISNNVLSQKNGMNEENLIRFFTTYKDVDPLWIILGENSMLVENEGPDIIDKSEIQVKIQEVTPDFLLKRFEEVVIENSELKKQLEKSKGLQKYTNPDMPTMLVADAQTELKTSKE